MRSRYSKWDGSQDPFAADHDIGDLLDEIYDDLLSGLGPDRAVRRLMRRGLEGGTRGLDELSERLARRRAELASNLNLEGPLADIKDRLDEIVATERQELAGRDSEDARMRETMLDTLPSSPASAIKELMDYRFTSPEAQERFDALVQQIQSEVLGSYFRQMAGSMQQMSPDDIARMREMVADLNAMIAARESGQPYDFEGFMQRHGDFFPENPRTLDELLELLARRMAAMSRLLASMSPEQRRQLQELAEAVLGVAFEMDMLSQELRALMPNLPWDESVPGWGMEPSSMAEAVDAVEAMSEMEELQDALEGRYAGSDIVDIDEDALRRALGEEAVRDLRGLKRIEKQLEEAGIVARNKGKLELTARGLRRLGERALVKVFEDLRHERPGSHDAKDMSGVAEPTGATRKWHFGDIGEIAVQKTVFNALTRQASERQTGSVRIHQDDFELVDAETRTRTATALLLDLSFSMPLRGHWVPAKKMALALKALIEGKYPQDHLYLIGFSDYARRLDASDLTATGNIERVYGTNMQHAFLLARRLLAQHPRSTKQVIMVTDGEPTAHLVDTGDGSGPFSVFSWPPTHETIHRTLAEATRLSSSGITLNIFMLEDEPGLLHFMDELARRTGGRVFRAANRDIGQFVLKDFVRRRT